MRIRSVRKGHKLTGRLTEKVEPVARSSSRPHFDFLNTRTRPSRDRTPPAKTDDAIVGWTPRPIGGRLKRAFDFVGALGLLIAFSPLYVAIAIAIKLGDGGPVVFAHRRIGLGGRAFSCLKFRSMVVDADRRLAHLLATNPAAAKEWAETQKLKDDVRITAVGRLLRRSSLDELPQLLNVLRGEMSLVGPRPVTLQELQRYDLDQAHYMRTRPGLTGAWQVSGRSNLSYARRISLDKSYALEWTFLKDLELLLRTVPVLLSRDGAV